MARSGGGAQAVTRVTIPFGTVSRPTMGEGNGSVPTANAGWPQPMHPDRLDGGGGADAASGDGLSVKRLTPGATPRMDNRSLTGDLVRPAGLEPATERL